MTLPMTTTEVPEICALRDRLAALTRERGEMARAPLDDAAIARLMLLRQERLALRGRLHTLEARIFPAFRSCAHD